MPAPGTEIWARKDTAKCAGHRCTDWPRIPNLGSLSAVSDWISLSWVHHHRRSAELGEALEAETVFVRRDDLRLPLRYFAQWRETRRLLRTLSPRAVQVMQPPPLALACIATSRRLRSAIIIGDLHSGTFTDPKWKWAAGYVLATLRKRGFAIVPNEELADLCRKAGVEVYVSHGFISPAPAQTDTAGADGFVLVPVRYGFDEPIDAILDAARRLPERRFVLTGNAPDTVRSLAPNNVEFSGFVSRDDYNELRSRASVVLALTYEEMTMQSAGYEALEDATPLVTSPTRVLRQFFGDAAVYARPTGESIAAAIKAVFADYTGFQQRINTRQEQQIEDQRKAIDAIRARVHQ